MLKYLIKRLGLALLTMFIILLVSYLLLRLAPGDPTKSSILGQSAAQQGLSSDKDALGQNRALRGKLYLDKPIYVGFWMWLRGVVLHGDLGTSAAVDVGRPVTDIIAERLPVTLTLNIWAIFITYLLAIPLGIYSAIKVNSMSDKVITFVLFFLYSLPVIWVALILQALLCEGGWMPIFPLKGLVSANNHTLSIWGVLWQRIMHYILPVICLTYAGFAGLSRYARASMLDVITQDYIRTARAKGLPEFLVIFKHALRNAVIILITLFAGLLPGLIAGSIIIEYVFSIPGMGSLSLMALNSRDYPLQMALFGFGGLLTLVGIILSDFLYVIADPRITFSSTPNR